MQCSVRVDDLPTWSRKTLALTATIAAIIALHLAVIRPWFRQWGATDAEATRSLPGDDIVPGGVAQTTRAITIRAPIEDVWPWLAQLGQDRGGFYSYEVLEDLVGTHMTNADEILPQHQAWKPGDRLWMYPPGAFEQAGIPLLVHVPGRALAFGTWQIGTAASEPPDGSWAFVLEPIDGNTTRFLVRGRARGGQPLLAQWFGGGVFEQVHFVMERKMMTTLAARAEGTPVSWTADTIEVVCWAFTVALIITAFVLVIRRRAWIRPLAGLAGGALAFQGLTFLQPGPIIAMVVVTGLAMALFLPARAVR
jgi:hypothetical protein